MVRITTDCPRCERVELGADDITLVVSPLEDNAWYMFDCMSCAHHVVKTASSSAVLALTSVHVALSIVPAEVVERTRLGKDRPMDTDDLLDALLWLRACSGPGGPAADLRSIDSFPQRQAERGPTLP